MATPVEEHAILKQFVQELWKGPEFLPCASPVPPGLPFGLHQLRNALKAIPSTKAVARPFTPGLVWHAHANTVAPLLFQALQFLWDRSDPIIPACWRDSWLLLIPKPFKLPNKPESLRPLALQEPLGKCLDCWHRSHSMPPFRAWSSALFGLTCQSAPHNMLSSE